MAKLFITSNVHAPLPSMGEAERVRLILVPTMEMHIKLHSLRPIAPDEVARSKMPDVRYYLFGSGIYRETTSKRTLHQLKYCVFGTYGNTGVTPCYGTQSKQYTNSAE
jgi:hypothetical protein